MPYTTEDLLYLMQRLRDPVSGCPWDRKQSATDIINYSIEEVYELADAIETGSVDATKDELGDVLFQVVFLARLAEEQGDYSFASVVDNLVEKLVRRHPHVFPAGELRSENKSPEAGAEMAAALDDAGVKSQWEQIKQQERVAKNQGGLLDDIPGNLPALNRAAKLQKRAATIGLDWADARGPLQKVREESTEVEQLLGAEGDVEPDELLAELGDLLFSVVNVCRKTGISPEQALRVANRKFAQRVNFLYAHPEFPAAEPDWSEAQRMQQLDRLWELAKQQGM